MKPFSQHGPLNQYDTLNVYFLALLSKHHSIVVRRRVWKVTLEPFDIDYLSRAILIGKQKVNHFWHGKGRDIP